MGTIPSSDHGAASHCHSCLGFCDPSRTTHLSPSLSKIWCFAAFGALGFSLLEIFNRIKAVETQRDQLDKETTAVA